jgi:hypothetical protein
LIDHTVQALLVHGKVYDLSAFLALSDRYFVLDRKLLKFNGKIYYQKLILAMSVSIYETVKAALENDDRQ